jgi:predicted metal-dependent phosphotriesterase family hydrolase
MLFNRRDVCRLLALGAGAGIVTGLQEQLGLSSPAAQSARSVTFPRGAIIRTILRDVDPKTLAGGATLVHEHISIADPLPPWRRQPEKPVAPYGADIDLMVEEVKATAKDGVSCIVNPGTKDLGQNIEHLRAIATRSGVSIVVAGGYHVQSNYPPDVAQKTESQIAEELLRDSIAERWGALGELGSSGSPMHPDERKVLRAACTVHLQTGLPIFTHTPHTGCKACGLEQMDIIESMGVDPRLVSIGHVSDITDDPKAESHKAIAKRGAFLAFDTVGRRLTQSDSKKLEMVLAVIDAGYEDHVLLGSDFASRQELKVEQGAGFGSAVVVFVPKMRYAGVKEETIRKILVDNPRRFLAFVPKMAK